MSSLSSIAGSCLRCHDDFSVFANRRGGGGGNAAYLTLTPTGADLKDSASTGSILTTLSNWNEPSVGWRTVPELPVTIKNGLGNFWIGAISPTAPANVNHRLPELLHRRRTQSVGASDVGPMLLRAAPATLTPTVAGMCRGAYAGTSFVAEKYGLVRDFTQMSVRVAAWNPFKQSGGIGFVFNQKQVFSATTGYALTQYVAIFRATAGGPELCAGVYKVTAGVVTAVGTSSTISALDGFQNALNPTLLTTPITSRNFTRIGVSKSGGTIQLWIDTPLNIVNSVADATPLPAGAVGIANIGVNSIVYDDFMLMDAPTCTDGIWNGEEEGIDCGGTSIDGACPACAASATVTHNFATDGVQGWHRETYCTSSGARVPVYTATHVSYTTNCNFDWPGQDAFTAANNIIRFGGAWFMIASKWPTATNIDITITQNPGDDDRQGLVWRYQDSQNYYMASVRSEIVGGGYPVSIQKRRNGINSLLYTQVNMDPKPHIQTVVQYFRVVMQGNLIEFYSNRNGGTGMVLIGSAVDPDPLTQPGYVGHTGCYQSPANNAAFSYTINRPAVSLNVLPDALAAMSVAAQKAMGFYGDVTPASGVPLGSLWEYRGQSTSGFSLAGSPLYVSSAILPGVDENLSPFGSAIRFGGSHVLWAQSRLLGDVGITGMTILIAFMPLSAKLVGTAGVVLGKGLRERTAPDAAGWRLQMVNIADRPISGSNATQALQFVTQSGVTTGVDTTADVAHPIDINFKHLVVAIRVKPTTIVTGGLNTRTFTVDAKINGVDFQDLANKDFTGIVSSSMDGYLSLGATDIATDGMSMGVFETMVFEDAISDSDFSLANTYLINRYANPPAFCPDISNSQAGAVVTAGNCASATDGMSCTLGCTAGFINTASAASLLCRFGSWLGAFPRCESKCADLSAPGTGQNACKSMIMRDSWDTVGVLGQASSLPTYRHWTVKPLGNHWAVSVVRSLSVSQPANHRFVIPLRAFLNSPSWAYTTSGLLVTQSFVVPTNPVLPMVVSVVPRYMDASNYYYIDLSFDSSSVQQTLRMRRAKNGVEVVVCTSAEFLSGGSEQVFQTSFEIGTGGIGLVKSSRNGLSWCTLTETAPNYISSGSAGLALQAMPGFSAVQFGAINVESVTKPCLNGCSGVVANSTCTLTCNLGTIATGSLVRQCLPDGNYSGTALRCENGAPVISDVATSIPERSLAGAAVGVPFPTRLMSGKDGAGTIVFEIISGNTLGAFSMDACDGQVRVLRPDLLDFEAKNANSSNLYTLRVRAYIAGSDPIAEAFANMSVSVTNVDDPPQLVTTTCAVLENSVQGSPVCTLATMDPDTFSSGPAVFSIAFQEVPGVFNLDTATGAITVGNVGLFGAINFDNNDGKPVRNEYALVINVAAAAAPTVTSTGMITIKVTDVIEAPFVRPTCAIVVDAALMNVAGATVPNFNAIADCILDEDAASSVSAFQATVITNALVFVSSGGQAQVIASKSYTTTTPYLLDGRLVVDYGTMSLKATDNNSLVGIGTIGVYVMANVSSVGPVIRSATVLPIMTSSGSGNVNGELWLNTNGQDSIKFAGDNLLYTVTDIIVANVTSSTSTSFWTVTCGYLNTGALSGSLPLADAIICPTGTGWGRGWTWVITLKKGAGAATTILSSVALVTHYAPPIVTAIGPPGQPGQPMNYPTVGRTPIALLGHNLGPAGTRVVVDFGLVDVSTGTVTWSLDMISGIVPAHVTATGLSKAGAGANLLVRVTVGGLTTTAGDGVFMMYNIPTITTIARIGTTGLPNGVVGFPVLSGKRTLRAGQIINITGTNFGPASTQGKVLRFGLPSVANDNLPYLANCYYPVAAASHTFIQCIAPPAGSGTYTAILSIANQQSARTLNTSTKRTVVYHTVHVQTVTGPGARLADTRGGQVIFFTGSNFGPRSAHLNGACPKPQVWYGMSNGTVPVTQYMALSYEMTDCEVLDDLGTQMSCRMVAGTGWSANYFRWTIMSCGRHGWTGLLATVRYAPPIVTSYEDDDLIRGSTGANTRGGSAVTIYGANFGPTMQAVAVKYYAPITGMNGVVREVAFSLPATSCRKPDPLRAHEMIVCTMVEGAGTRLRWEVVVDNQLSEQPTSGYKNPTITAVSTSDSDSTLVVNSATAGQEIYIHGTQFGPAIAGNAGRSLVQSVEFGPSGAAPSTAYVVSAAAFGIWTPHSVIRVTLPDGIGKLLSVKVKIADVETGATAAVIGQSISYSPPSVAALLPTSSSTRGGQTVKVYLLNAGLLDTTTTHTVFVSTTDVAIVERFPTESRVSNASGDLMKLTADERDVSKHYLAFIMPDGVGNGHAVLVKASRKLDASSTVSSDPDAISSTFNYDEPVLNIVAAERLSPEMQDEYLLSLGLDNTTDLTSWRVLTILGSNFGADDSVYETTSSLEFMEKSENGTYVDPGGPPKSGSSVVVQVLLWSHDRIRVLVTLKAAEVRLRVAGVSWIDSDGDGVKDRAEQIIGGVGTPQLSNPYTYLDVAAVVHAVYGEPAGGYATAGNTENLIVDAKYISSFIELEVIVGNTSCVFLTSDGSTPVNGLNALRDIVTSQVVAQSQAGVNVADMIFRLIVRVPPGQGSGVGVYIIRDEVKGPASKTIKYAQAALGTVSVVGAVSQVASTATLSNPFRVPTQGADAVLVGTNFGVCPILTFGSYAVDACATQPAAPSLRITAHNHTHIEFQLPAGVGAGLSRNPQGLQLYLDFGSQKSLNAVFVAYGLPKVTAVVGLSSAGKPTTGNVVVEIQGSNFGPLNAPLPIVTIVDPFGNRTVLCSNDDRVWPRAVRSVTSPHSVMTCVLPEGSGAGLSVDVTVDDQSAVSAGAFSYDTPVVASVGNIDADFSARGDTPGGYQVLIKGNNFGPSNNSGHCVFLPYSGVALSSLLCNGKADSWDEYQVPTIKSWNHTDILLQMVAGMGAPVVRVHARGAFSVPAAVGSDVFTYNRPVITSVSPPTSDTDGGTEITINGTNFGFGSTAAANAARTVNGSVPLAFQLPQPGQAGAFPSPYAMRVNFFTALRCISSSVIADTADNTAPASVQLCKREDTGYGVVTHTHNTIVFKALPGVGKNRTLSVSILDPSGAEMKSNGVAFSYTPPSIESVEENRLQVTAPFLMPADQQPSNKATYATTPSPVARLTLTGKNFGPLIFDASATTDETKIEIFIGGSPCTSPVKLISKVDGVDTVTLECDYARSRASGLPLSDPSIPKVGYRKVVANIAGQTTLPTSFDLFQVRCAKAYYGAPGEVCDVCPTGAQCNGYVEKAGVETTYVNDDGLNVTECISCHTQPGAKAGYFNMKGYLNAAGESESTCSELRKAEGKRKAVECDYIVTCDPPESCLANNVCGDGYSNSKWPYRCSQCADGFFRSAGSCRKCPDNPALNIVFFFLVAIVAIVLAWFLNQKQINIAFLTIGLDYMQVISIFANTRIPWPAEIKELFRILSAFNLNIEIVAPECAFKGITYSQKWGMIMALPVAVNMLLLALFVTQAFYMICVRGQKRNMAFGNAAPLLAMAQVLMYFLYLYITRSVFDIFTCRSSIPPEFDPSGAEILYMAGAFERCGVTNGVQVGLLPGAVAALIFYVLAYPAFIGWNLYKNLELAMEDQLLRAKGTGNDKMSNPHALEFRRRWARAYYQFRPDMCLWVLAILGRKFLIAIASLIFNTNQNFQMAAMLLVLFVAYAAQVRFLPYMGPSTFDAVLKLHQEAARNGNPTHLRLAATIAGVESQGKKRTHANKFNLREVNATAVLGAVAAFLFDYNTVEALLLASALMVALAGVMFGASEATKTSAFYQDSRKGVMGALIAIVALSIIYWATVVVVEVYSTLRSRSESVRTAAASRKAAKKAGKRGSKGGNDDEDSDATPASVFDPGSVENANNPLFMKNDADQAGSVALDASAVRSISVLTSQTVWEALRASYVATAEQLASMDAEAARLRAELNASTAEAEEGMASGAKARLSIGKKAASVRTAVSTNNDDDDAEDPECRPRKGMTSPLRDGKGGGSGLKIKTGMN